MYMFVIYLAVACSLLNYLFTAIVTATTATAAAAVNIVVCFSLSNVCLCKLSDL